MKMTRRMAVGMVWVMFAVPWLQIQARAEAAGKGTPPARIYFDASRDSTRPDKVYASLWERQQRGILSFRDTLDLAMSLYLQQRWEQAAGVYQSAAASVKAPTEKAAATLGAAQCLANAQRWRDAAGLANQASRLVPNSKEAASARYAFWKKAGDELEATIAEDRIKQLDLKTDGKVVFEPLTVGVVIIVAVTTAYVTWVSVVKPEDPNISGFATTLLGVLSTTLALQARYGPSA